MLCTCFYADRLGDTDLAGDHRVRAAFGYQREDLAFADAQRANGIVAVRGTNEFLHEVRVDHYAT